MIARIEEAAKKLEGFSNEHKAVYEKELEVYYEQRKGIMNANAPLFSKALTAIWDLYLSEKSTNGFGYFNEIKIRNDMECLYNYYLYAKDARPADVLELRHQEKTAKFSAMINLYMESANPRWRHVGHILLGVGIALIVAALASAAVTYTAITAVPLVVMTPFIDAAVIGGVGLLLASTGLFMSFYNRPSEPARLMDEIREQNKVGLFAPSK